MATHSRIFAWEVTWTEESGGLQSMVPQRVRYDWVTELMSMHARACAHTHAHTHTRTRLYMYHIFFIHPSVDGHLGCFYGLALVNSAAANPGEHVCFQIMLFVFFFSRVNGLLTKLVEGPPFPILYHLIQSFAFTQKLWGCLPAVVVKTHSPGLVGWCCLDSLPAEQTRESVAAS